jgi:dihydrofolate reductase
VGKIVATEFLTVDGVMGEPHLWHGPFFSEDVGKYKLDEVFATDALLLGRVTYEGFAAAWPSRSDPDGFADRFNNLPKHVVSSTLKELSWNNSHLIEGDLGEEVRKLKGQPGQDVVIHGSAMLVNSLLQLGLIDEYRLMVFPLVRGGGKRLFHDGADTKTLALVDTKTFSSGVVVLTYAPARDE